MDGRSSRINLEEKSWRKIWPRRFEQRRTDFRFRNGRRRIGRQKRIICERMKRRRRHIFREIARRKSEKCFAIRSWRGRSSRSRSTGEMRFTKGRLRQKIGESRK